MILKGLLFGTLFFAASPAYAYIDPGTGATFVGTLGPLIIGFVTAVAAFGVKYFWNPIKSLFGKVFGRKAQ